MVQDHFFLVTFVLVDTSVIFLVAFILTVFVLGLLVVFDGHSKLVTFCHNVFLEALLLLSAILKASQCFCRLSWKHATGERKLASCEE